MPLTPQQRNRYSRHLALPEVGAEGQEKLLAAKVLIAGLGGLGSPAALYLAAAGVGRLGVADFDIVDASNLQRQVIHCTGDIGSPKVDSARAKIQKINPDVQVDTHGKRLDAANALEIVKNYDVVVDGTDNFPARYLLNDACVLAKKPYVYGSIAQFEGQASVFYPGKGPCYRCLFPEPPPAGMAPSCAQAGVLGILPGVIGLIQATEAIKIILGKGELLVGRLLLYHALDMRFKEIKVQWDPQCLVCGCRPTIQELRDLEENCKDRKDGATMEITVQELKQWMDQQKKFTLVDVREQDEFDAGRIPGSVLIPIGSLPQRLKELSPEGIIVTHCKAGGRSSRAAEFLRSAGYKNVYNLRGGFGAWAKEIDPTAVKRNVTCHCESKPKK